MKSLASKLIPVAVASILCGAALAGGGKEDHMKMMDKDGDGKVTAAEHAQGAKAMFSKMDTDRDGQVTAAEMDAAHATMKSESKERTARGEDSYENEGRTKKQYDETGSGKAMAGKMKSSAQKIAAMDSNNDGKLSAAEHDAGAKQMFGKMDTDSDGSLTAKEVREGERSHMTAGEME